MNPHASGSLIISTHNHTNKNTVRELDLDDLDDAGNDVKIALEQTR